MKLRACKNQRKKLERKGIEEDGVNYYDQLRSISMKYIESVLFLLIKVFKKLSGFPMSFVRTLLWLNDVFAF